MIKKLTNNHRILKSDKNDQHAANESHFRTETIDRNEEQTASETNYVN
jgi:hypothetical protein